MNTPTPIRQYRTGLYPLFMIGWLAFCALAIWNLIQTIILVSRHPEDWFFLLIAPLYFWGATIIFQLFRDYRLVILERGIKYETLRYTIYSDWKNIKHRKQAFLWQMQLVLENPVVEKRKGWWLWLDASFWLFRPPNIIPIGSSVWEKYDEAEAELRKQAPHLFQI